MEFLAILIALGLLQAWGSGGSVQRDEWFEAFGGWIAQRLGGAARELCVVLLPVLGIALLQFLLDDLAFGLPELLLFTVALLYALGRGDITASIAEYMQRWSRGDFQAAFEQLQGDGLPADAQEEVGDPQQLHARMRRHFYYRSHERLFAVLFWFMVAGPAGAVAYRLARLDQAARSGAEESPEGLRLVHWMDWIPVRLVGIGYALIGHFDACLDAWRPLVLEPDVDAQLLLESCGNAALGLSDQVSENERQEALIQRGMTEIAAIEVLQRRSLIVWVVVIAFLSIGF